MTREEHIQQSAHRKLMLTERMMDYGLDLCNGRPCVLFDLVVASSGLVLSLYLEAMKWIDEDDAAPDDLKDRTRKLIQHQVDRILTMALAAVRSDNPRAVLAEQIHLLVESLDMGPTDGEVH